MSFPKYRQTWEWFISGKRAVDRLSVRLGSVASKNNLSRYVRNHPKDIENSIIVEPNKLLEQKTELKD